jgi:Ca2+-binding RTX toxin-like protein
VLRGLGGNDVILGQEVSDELVGGSGRDLLVGASGSDTLSDDEVRIAWSLGMASREMTGWTAVRAAIRARKTDGTPSDAVRSCRMSHPAVLPPYRQPTARS